MLPSTGLFKCIACPYYNGGGSSNASGITCHRPYCHFKHIKKEELESKILQISTTATTTSVPEYTPAPKLQNPSGGFLSQKKKKSLEYRPDKPELQYTKSSRLKKSSASSVEVTAPVYVPSSANNFSAINLDDCNEELDELTEIFDEELSQTESLPREDESSIGGYIESKFSSPEEVEDTEESLTGLKEFKDVSTQEKNDKNSESSKDLDRKGKESQEIEKVEKNITSDSDKEQKTSGNNTKSSEKDRHHSKSKSSRESTSSSRHKHKSSSRSKERGEVKDCKTVKDCEKNDTDARKDREKKDKDRDKITSSSLASAASSSRSKHSSSNSHPTTSTSSETKHRKHNSTHSSSSSSSSSLKRGSSSTLGKKKENMPNSDEKSKEIVKSKKHRSQNLPSSSSNHKAIESTEKDEENVGDEPAELFATSEADIMKECEMIYDQLEQEYATLHQNTPSAETTEKEHTVALKRKPSLDEEEPSAGAAASSRKRVAYENADKLKKDTPVMQPKPNHVRNAMQAIYNRQTMLRKKQEEEASAAEVALREAEDRVREANEALRKVKAQNLTPLIPRSYLRPPTKIHSRSIAPVANILALERAKKRVEELKAEKRPAFTPAQTLKGHGRVAHKPTAAGASTTSLVNSESQMKPPVLESTSTKISFNIRMQYYEMMVKHCLVIYPNTADAWERAQSEELTVFKKCNTPVIYKSSALLAINKLRKEAADSGNKPDCSNKIVSHEVILAGKLAHTTSWSMQKKMKTDTSLGSEPFDKLPSDKAFDVVYQLRLTDEQLISNGFPRTGKRPGTATITCLKPMRCPNETDRYCSRCGKVFSLSMYDEICVDECNYHPKSTGYRRGFADNQHRCCQQPAGTAGCSYANYHVSDYFDANRLTGYIATISKGDDYVSTKKDIYALDCEMCYTTHGIELTRVTVVDINARTVYDALVKPDNKIVDYNTVYSGITEQMLENETRTLRDVQAILMSMFHSKTVLIGHSLESDLKALKLIHNVVVDTSVLFPHKMGPPKKRALKTLCVENLKRIIQENEAGHDSAEDAEVCIHLVKFYLRNKIS